MGRGYTDDRNRDRWRDEDRERSSYGQDRDEDRGFLERAGDEIRSWFSDDEDDRRFGREQERGSWDRDPDQGRGGMQRSSWESDRNRGGSSWDRERSGGSRPDYEDRGSFGGMSQGGMGRSVGWDRDQSRGGYSPSRGGSGMSSSDRDRSRRGGFGGYRDESDFRGQHRRDHPQSWSEANQGENESLGFGEYRGTLGGFGNQTFGSSEHDHYRNWRDREMAKLDRDYDDYCREREHQFNQDFDSWRRSRQGQSPSASKPSSGDLGAASNAGVGTTTASVTGSAGAGSAIGSATGTGGSIQADTTGSTEPAGTGGGRSGSRSRS
jgi:hypothetical protein